MARVVTSKRIDPARVREAVLAVAPWLHDDTVDAPARTAVAEAVRLTARTVAVQAPGNSVELRVPPFVAVQCVAGPRHTRGTPPNVVELSPRDWLLAATGLLTFDDAAARGTISGHRAPVIADFLPVVPLSATGH